MLFYSNVSRRKKYVVVDNQYLENGIFYLHGNTQQCDIFRHDKYNLSIFVCEVLTQNVKCNVMTVRKMISQTGLG